MLLFHHACTMGCRCSRWDVLMYVCTYVPAAETEDEIWGSVSSCHMQMLWNSGHTVSSGLDRDQVGFILFLSSFCVWKLCRSCVLCQCGFLHRTCRVLAEKGSWCCCKWMERETRHDFFYLFPCPLLFSGTLFHFKYVWERFLSTFMQKIVMRRRMVSKAVTLKITSV